MNKFGTFFGLLKKNIQNINSPHSYEAGDLEVFCPHCKHNKFYHDYRLLNSAGMTFFKLDFANKEAHVLTCARCGHIQWFGLKIYKID